jgi:methylmalonyl-CoA mutase C-terminal domain/subunit
MEVIYTPPWQSIEAVVRLATEEDVDVIGLSSLATDHLIVPQLMQALRRTGLEDVGVVVGGIVPPDEHHVLYACGVSAIFGPGSARETIVRAVDDLARRAQSRRKSAVQEQAS